MPGREPMFRTMKVSPIRASVNSARANDQSRSTCNPVHGRTGTQARRRDPDTSDIRGATPLTSCDTIHPWILLRPLDRCCRLVGWKGNREPTARFGAAGQYVGECGPESLPWKPGVDDRWYVRQPRHDDRSRSHRHDDGARIRRGDSGNQPTLCARQSQAVGIHGLPGEASCKHQRTSQSATSAAVCPNRSSGWRQPSSRWGSTGVPGIEMATLVLYSTRSATACPAARSTTAWSG